MIVNTVFSLILWIQLLNGIENVLLSLADSDHFLGIESGSNLKDEPDSIWA